MTRTPTKPPDDKLMWKRALKPHHPDMGGTPEDFVWLNNVRELVCSGRIGAGDVAEEPKKKHEPPRTRTRNADGDRVPLEPEEDFDNLTYRALLTARGVPEKYAHLLRLLKDCEEARHGSLVKEQQRGASYKRLAAIGHESRMDVKEIGMVSDSRKHPSFRQTRRTHPLQAEEASSVRDLYENIPKELQELDQWVCWSYEGGTKVPKISGTSRPANSTDPKTWRSCEECVEAAEKYPGRYAGIGFVFTKSDPYAGVDLDGCRNPETSHLEEWTRELVAGLDSYAEVSPSGTGVKVFVRGALPPGRKRKGRIEMYDSGRFFTVTGHRLPDAPMDVMERTGQLVALHCRVFGPAPGDAPERQAHARPTDPPGGTALDDAELVRRARSAANGEKFARLWSGDTGGYADGDNEGRSKADLALCSLLAFWTRPDESRIDGLFRQSALMRPKWDERHYGDGRTYGQGTIEHALAGRLEFWSEGASAMSAGKVYPRRKGAVSVG